MRSNLISTWCRIGCQSELLKCSSRTESGKQLMTAQSIPEKIHDAETLLNHHCERSYHNAEKKASTSSELLANFSLQKSDYASKRLYFALYLTGLCLSLLFSKYYHSPIVQLHSWLKESLITLSRPDKNELFHIFFVSADSQDSKTLGNDSSDSRVFAAAQSTNS